MADTGALALHPDRLLPAEPGVRAIARELYGSVRDLPVISPHGHVDPRLLAKVEKQERKTAHREPLKTWARDCTIVPDFIGHTFLVHNGRQFMKVFVTEDMIGHKLGEFAPTRLFRGHSGGKAKAAAPGAK